MAEETTVTAEAGASDASAAAGATTETTTTDADSANAALASAGKDTGDGSNTDAAGESSDGKESDGKEGEGSDDADGESGDDALAWAEGSDAPAHLLETANPILDKLGLDGEGKKQMLDLYQDIRATEEAEYMATLNAGFDEFKADGELWDGTKPTQKVLDAFASLKNVSPAAAAFIESQGKYGSLVNKGLADIAMLIHKHGGEGTMIQGDGGTAKAGSMYPNTQFNKGD